MLAVAPGKALNVGPTFAVEPPALVEYSNSTGTVIACRAQASPSSMSVEQVSAVNPNNIINKQKQEALTMTSTLNSEQQQRWLAGTTPTAISWRLVRRLPSALVQQENPPEHLEGDEEVLSGNSQLRFVRQDGALVFPPFRAADLRSDTHLATYKCCLSNRFGSLCSRPVRTRAGKFSSLK